MSVTNDIDDLFAELEQTRKALAEMTAARDKLGVLAAKYQARDGYSMKDKVTIAALRAVGSPARSAP